RRARRVRRQGGPGARRERPAHRGRRPRRGRLVRARRGPGRRGDRRDRRARRPGADHGRRGCHRPRTPAARDPARPERMTDPSGVIREDASSPDEAAGESPTSAVNTGSRPGRRRGSRQWRVVFFALLAAGAVAVAGWVLFLSPLLAVRSVVVTGSRQVPASEVIAAAAVEPGTPLVRVNTAAAAARVGLIRQVRSVQVTRSWPDRVVIVVQERVPALDLTTPGGGYDLMDSGGVEVRWSARRDPGLPLYLTSVPVTALRGNQDLAAAV